MLKIIGTSSLGTVLEYYDFLVYVALTSTLTGLFLPAQDKFVASLMGVATFGIAYLARPIGTLISARCPTGSAVRKRSWSRSP